jgi:phage terminase Nu1 subunit (DNA packaging protein)
MTLLYLRNKIVDNANEIILKRPDAESVLAFIENTLLPLKQAADYARENPEKQHLVAEAEDAIAELQQIADTIQKKIDENPEAITPQKKK